ncbi:MAG: hypothetical protein RLO48_07565 [Bauldia litoralis]|jgi:hypothetical protein
MDQVSAYEVMQLESFALSADHEHCLLRFRDAEEKPFVLAVPTAELETISGALAHVISRLEVSSAPAGSSCH